ncbi:MAG TPA: nucleoside-diphosphate kinase, partial [Actinomycetota bacterium]|nr:nucleoside-diphosphate kinase [Actinomycetota bacterium]
RDRPFFPELVSFVASGPVVAAVVEGPGAVGIVRAMVGRTDPTGSPPGTVRGDLGTRFPENVMHASHGSAQAAREIPLLFPELEAGGQAGAADLR